MPWEPERRRREASPTARQGALQPSLSWVLTHAQDTPSQLREETKTCALTASERASEPVMLAADVADLRCCVARWCGFPTPFRDAFFSTAFLLVSISSAADLRSKQIQGKGKPRSNLGKGRVWTRTQLDPVRGCSVVRGCSSDGQRLVALFGSMMHSGMLESYYSGGRHNMCFQFSPVKNNKTCASMLSLDQPHSLPTHRVLASLPAAFQKKKKRIKVQ
jgi:hypothetical protein